MNCAYLAFTARGEALARRLAEALPGSVSRCGGEVTLKGWTAEHFVQNEALIFVGAVGIAVRAVAPYCKSKASDPAVGARMRWPGRWRRSAARCRSSRRPPTSTAFLP